MEKSGIVYGKNAVEALLETGKRQVNKIFLAKGVNFDPKLRKILNLAKEAGIVVQEVPREKLNIMSEDASHQGILASVSPVEYMELDDFIATLKEKHEGNSLIVMLDGVEDPHNFGSIVRTAYAAGVDGIIIPKRRSSPVTSVVEKASAGAVENIPIIQVTNLTNTIENLKKENFWVIGAEGSANQDYFDTDYNMNCVLVLGGEDKGVSLLVKKHCDILVKIPMLNKINSLNVANAASILIYEVVRQKLKNMGKYNIDKT